MERCRTDDMQYYTSALQRSIFISAEKAHRIFISAEKTHRIRITCEASRMFDVKRIFAIEAWDLLDSVKLFNGSHPLEDPKDTGFFQRFSHKEENDRIDRPLDHVFDRPGREDRQISFSGDRGEPVGSEDDVAEDSYYKLCCQHSFQA